MVTSRILKYGLVAIIASVLSTAEARPKKDKGKGEKPNHHQKVDREKVKERLKAAFDKRKKRRGDAKKRGHKVHHKGAFGKLIRNDEKIQQLKKDFAAATKKIKGGFDKSKFKDATDEQKAALRAQMKASHKESAEAMRAHQKKFIQGLKKFAKSLKIIETRLLTATSPESNY